MHTAKRSVLGQKWILAGTQSPWSLGLAETLLSEGLQLLAFSSSIQDEQRFKKPLRIWGDQLICLHGDLHHPQAQEALQQHLQEAWSFVDGIVFPGFVPKSTGPFKDLTQKSWMHIFEENLHFPARMHRCFLPLLERSPEKAFLVQVGLSGLLEPMPHAAVYGMVAAAQHHLLISLREEWKATHLVPFEIGMPWQDLQQTQDFKALGLELGQQILSMIQSPSSWVSPDNLLGS